MVRIFALWVCVLLCQVWSYGAHRVSVGNGGRSRLEIKSVEIRHMGDVDFKTIGEYFGEKKEHQYFRCVVRDAENKREGTYFIVGLNAPIKKLPGELFVKIHIMAAADDARAFTCKIPEDGRFPIVSEVYCGIVSEKIDISKIRAWKVELEDGEGNILATKKSYMWEL